MSRTRVGYYSELSTGSGVGNYESELFQHLLNRDEVELGSINPSSYELPIVGDYISFTKGVSNDLEEADDDYDVIHLPTQLQAAGLLEVNVDTPVVVTVHDIIPYVSGYGNALSRLFAQLYVRGLKNADHIIAISEHTKEDILNYTEIDEEKISVIIPDVDTSRLENPAPEIILEEQGITKPYLFYVGTQGEKKNLKVIFSALREFNDTLTSNFDFVITGGAGNPIQSTLTAIQARRAGVSGAIVPTGFVSDDELAQLYDSAFAFVFPSKYEGFGRPTLEAMSLDTPVIASSATAIPEIVGKAAILCDPDSPSEWVAAFEELKQQEKRDEYIIRGRERLEKFSWTEASRQTVELYEKIY